MINRILTLHTLKQKIRGFTLLELAIFVLALALLLSSILMPLAMQVEQQYRNETRTQLEQIQLALIGYVLLNGYFPCSDSDYPPDGVENRQVSGNCVALEGYLPYAQLGTVDKDAWGRPFRFRTRNPYVQTTGMNWGSASDIVIRTVSGQQVTNTTDTDVLALIFSCGRNGRPDPTSTIVLPQSNDSDGITNSDSVCRNGGSNNDYVADAMTETFDDIVVWISKNTLAYHVTQAKIYTNN
ncbi:type II secretory pathway, pseudopilin PulG [Beggiatoa alba B18LD]|uniref:Type II secretory pathway, pseudopilin PulG n=1 Tax=Beggiatoa alba B18LD TaxID=395493 RepID=I3CH97_9GAMM|nr:hypothetical protein [Beggiatoa alba]EIJ42990.1 type II secretory pathway, pseudopilin PulG [Beggiatoa alba B18LD]